MRQTSEGRAGIRGSRLEGNAKRNSERGIAKGMEDGQSADALCRKFLKVSILLLQTLNHSVNRGVPVCPVFFLAP
jgi:hypothetical protein